jgi:methionyl-tRNA formyltransferase
MTGASTFLLEEGLDTGPVFGHVTAEIGRADTSGDMLARLADSGASLLRATLDAIEDGTARPVPQPADGITHAPKVTAEDARVDWKAPALRVDRLVRACTPAPGAWTVLPGHGDGGEELRVKIFPLTPLPGATDVPPGRIVLDKRGLLVGTGSGHCVRLGDVQPQGKRRMAAADWARGVRLTGDEVFA